MHTVGCGEPTDRPHHTRDTTTKEETLPQTLPSPTTNINLSYIVVILGSAASREKGKERKGRKGRRRTKSVTKEKRLLVCGPAVFSRVSSSSLLLLLLSCSSSSSFPHHTPQKTRLSIKLTDQKSSMSDPEKDRGFWLGGWAIERAPLDRSISNSPPPPLPK